MRINRRSEWRRPGVRSLLAGALLASALAAPAGLALAQSPQCDDLRARIAAASQAPSGEAARYAAAAQKQQSELERTASYARSIGCGNRQFLFFGSPPPPQCGDLESRIASMRANIASLQARGGGQRQALQARYDASCRTQPRGFFETLFGGAPPRQEIPIERVPDSNTDETPDVMTHAGESRPRGGGEAVCVRTCDGGYFPMTYSARRDRLEALEDLCHAQCPGAETALYTMPVNGSINQAVSVDGAAYTDLPNANKFRTQADAACACKPPNQSWAEALQPAEDMLGQQSKSDILVTPEKSAEMARPILPATASASSNDATATTSVKAPAHGRARKPSAPPKLRSFEPPL